MPADAPPAPPAADGTNEPEPDLPPVASAADPAERGPGVRTLLGHAAAAGFGAWRRKDRKVAVQPADGTNEPDLVLSPVDLIPPDEMSADASGTAPTPELLPGLAAAGADTNEPEAKVQFGAFTLFRRNQAANERRNEPEPPVAASIGPAPDGPDMLDGAPDPAMDELPERSRQTAPSRPASAPHAGLGLTINQPFRRDVIADEEAAGRQAVARAVQEDALTVVRVPVVSLPQRRRRMVAIHQQCRHDGALSDAHRLLGSEADELRAALDLEMVRAAARNAERPVPGAENLPVVARLSTASFAAEEARTALATLLGRRPPQACALHLVLDAWPTERFGLELVAILRRAQVGIGLELAERPHLSPEAVAARKLSLVCLPADELHQASLGAYDSDLIRDIRAMQRCGVEVVVTGIRSERALVEVLDFPVQLGTGDLFGRIGA
ncbi:MAG TPA: hypothetical protein VHL31_13560 [Geminicoccus sp.]|jgi:EAL domain-containing protein (putative c-di-GMP-specific phosphodiesterase class I)|uniref:hypothetical protein n=1 Tax=Geminicoccus sp. TaxID=2024832 RepID=UPI002E2F9A42|nr:hypothetical protein [Geminicoccus sp.]HEX2527309.1 hypothetical protein [Geminicoccus sp.]